MNKITILLTLMLVLGTVMVSGCTEIPGIGGNGCDHGSGQDRCQDSNSGSDNGGDDNSDDGNR